MKNRLSILLLAAAAVSTAHAQAAKPTTSFTGDLGFVSSSGNTNVTTITVADKIVRTSGLWMFTQAALYLKGETSEKETANQLLAALRVDYAFLPRLSVFAGVDYEKNTFAGFNSRTDEIAALASKAILAPFDSARVDAGGVLTQESDVDGTSQNYPSARVAVNYKHQFTKLAYFHQFAEYLPNLKTSGAYRVNTESALVAPLSTHLGIKLSYSIRYDSKPQPNFGSTDRLFTTGIQISY